MRYSRVLCAFAGAGHDLPCVTFEFLGSENSTLKVPIRSRHAGSRYPGEWATKPRRDGKVPGRQYTRAFGSMY